MKPRLISLFIGQTRDLTVYCVQPTSGLRPNQAVSAKTPNVQLKSVQNLSNIHDDLSFIKELGK